MAELKKLQKTFFVIFIDSIKLKILGKKSQHFLNDAFQSYYDLFQVNWLVQN